MLDQDAIERAKQQAQKLRETFQKIIEKIKDLSPVFEKFKGEYSNIVNQNFEARGKIMERKRWKEYTPEYLALKQKKYPGKQMMEVTGDLRRANVNFDAQISKDKMMLSVKGDDYMYWASDRETYGRKTFYTLNNDMPIQAWRILIDLVKQQLEVEGTATI